MTSPGAVLEVHCLESVVGGHRVYKRIWALVVGEKLTLYLYLEEGSSNNRKVFAVLKYDIVPVFPSSSAPVTASGSPPSAHWQEVLLY